MNLRLIECPPFLFPEPSYAPGDCWYAQRGRRCVKCGCLWRVNADNSLSLASARQIPQACCDNTEFDAHPAWFWWANSDREFHEETEIAPEHRGRRPMIVVLPNGATFCLLSPTYKNGVPGDHGWTITGAVCGALPELPNVSLAPSVHFDPGGTREWHGFIQNGRMA